MYFFHPESIPAVCDVCAWVRDHPGADQLLEHTYTRIAIGLMVDDLLQEARSMTMLQLHRSAFGAPGPEHPLDPCHWFWALLVMPGFLITLDQAVAAREGALDV